MTVLYADLEEKSVPAFANANGVAAQASGQSQASSQQQQGQMVTPQTQLPTRANFQMGMAGL